MKEKTQEGLQYPDNDLYQSRTICVFLKVLKTTTSKPPPPSLQQSRRYFHLATAVIGSPPAPIPNKVCDWLGKQ